MTPNELSTRMQRGERVYGTLIPLSGGCLHGPGRRGVWNCRTLRGDGGTGPAIGRRGKASPVEGKARSDSHHRAGKKWRRN